ncbi:MAG: EAL domain-containing protein [Actinobacteria bacterium]|nr:EAL domain-containing protein [Actinomycetota bacterium]
MNVLLADDDTDFRRLLSLIVDTDRSLTLVGAAADADEAVRLANDTQPDVALLDVGMPNGGGVKAALEIREVSPATQILALSGSGEREAVIRMLRAGAIAYLIKGATPSEIVRAIKDAASGKTTLAPEAAQELVGVLRRHFVNADRLEKQRAEDREHIESLLRGEGIAVVLQPIFNIVEESIVGYEALARFVIEPRMGPDVWFQRAEGVGLRAELELAVLSRALPLLASIPEHHYLSVNLSPDVLAATDTDFDSVAPAANRLVIELTEHAPVADYPALNRRLAELRAHGLRLAVDDAGAGFASLQHILQLSPEYIKLDVSLTRHIDQDSPRRALASSLITFASQINATIVAEGVETKEELDALRELGVSCAQGFYLARPAPFGGWTIPGVPPKRLSQLLWSVTDVARRARTCSEAVSGFAETLSSEFPLWRISVRMASGRDQLVVAAAWTKGESALVSGIGMSVVATSFPEVVRRDRPVGSADPAFQMSFVEQLVRAEGIRSWISIPLHDGNGSVIGLLSLSSKEPDIFGEATLGFFAQLGYAVESRLVGLVKGSETSGITSSNDHPD